MRNSIKATIMRLNKIKSEVETYISNCNDTDEDRAGDLENELECIVTAIDALENIE